MTSSSGAVASRAELARYLAMQQVVTDLLARLVHTPTDLVDVAVDDALAVLGRFCGVARAYVFSVDSTADTIRNTHEWCAEGVTPEIANLQDVPFSVIEAWRAPLTGGQPVVIADVRALPAHRAAERELLEGQGIRSLAVVPMISGGRLTGFLGLDAVCEPRGFLEGEVAMLRSVADVISSAIVKAGADRTRRDAQDQLAYEARHDALTGLPNRVLLHERLARATRGTGQVAVLFADVDRFKLVNDSLGHATGDDLLVAIAGRLSAAAQGHLVARFGGDEFVVLIEDATTTDVTAVIDAVMTALGDGVPLRSGRHHLTLSIGTATSWTSGRDPETLIRDADTAMYVAKEKGRNCVVDFDESFHRQAVRRRLVFQSLPAALDQAAIRVVYQPIVELRSRRVVAAEALARWTDPVLGAVPTPEFIGVAEELGLITRLGEQVLSAALAEVAAAGDGLRVAVNLSPRQLTDPLLADRIAAQLDQVGLCGRSLTLEITESILVEQPVRTRQVLHDLRTLGVRVALDDFGTGYSSLSQLRDLPIDVLKIDRSFIAQLTSADRHRRFIRAIVALGHDLGMAVTAEGVETAQQVDALADLGCDYVQGFAFGGPDPLLPGHGDEADVHGGAVLPAAAHRL